MPGKGFEVIPHRKTVEGKKFYHQHYSKARTIDILGISCHSFVKDLYPAYWDSLNKGRPRTEGAVRERLQRMAPILLSSLRTRPIQFEVRLLNPACDYVESRMKEVANAEQKCRDDIIEVINALRCLYEDLKAFPLRIKGGVSIRLINKNPYFSIFRALPGPLLIGFITQDGMGNRHPLLSVPPTKYIDLLTMSMKHLEYLEQGSAHLFTWRGGSVKFTEYKGEDQYDVFLSYNAHDEKVVQDIDSGLRWKGIRSWLDTRVMEPADNVWNEIVTAAGHVNCAAVFLGPSGFGPYQQQKELPVLLSLLVSRGLKVIPVLLDGADGVPKWPDSLLSELLWVDFRKPKTNPLEKLVAAIKKANGDG